MGQTGDDLAAKGRAGSRPLSSGRHWLHASNLYSIAAYPHIKGDELAEQAQALANRAYEEAALRLPGELRELEFPVPGGAPVTGFYICRKAKVRSRWS